MNTASMKRLTMAFSYDLIVVGGGAAGMFSAGIAAKAFDRVLLLERNHILGKKLRITGKGRCNLSNNCQPEEVLQNIPTGSRFLYSSIYGFPPREVMAFFENLGVPLKTERGSRIFPQSDRAADVADALEQWLRAAGVKIRRGTAKKLLITGNCIQGVAAEGEDIHAPRVILATGGKSYPRTGSTGDGYRMARQAGHTVTPISGSLVPLETEEDCRALAGLRLRNAGVKLYGKKKRSVFTDFGELLFMPYGLGGPVALSASAHMDERDGPYVMELDLKPALDEKKLDARLLRDFEGRKNEPIAQGLRGVLPVQLVGEILRRSSIGKNRRVHDVTREERRRILEQMKHLRFTIAGKRPVEEAIITHGGVKLGEVNPATMESRLVKGLYFAGEILDADAYTGGFNLQIAWSTAWAAGNSCGKAGRDVL